MTEQEAANIRKLVGNLYDVARKQYLDTYYRLYNRKPGEVETFDQYVQSLWEESPIQEALYQLGAVGYKSLIEQGWNPLKPPEED